MQFPLDLVYLDRTHRVRKVRSNVPAWRISVCLSAHSILELPAGTILKTQTSPGDRIEFTPAADPATEALSADSKIETRDSTDPDSPPSPELLSSEFQVLEVDQ
jgi:hypothetical protein